MLQMQDENWVIIGLRLLQELLRPFETGIKDYELKSRIAICEATFPILESILG
tara:strand:- start:2779 stop:2937 length:159 start_codon:yes stop_codon:yes gene_type:complete